MIYENYCMEVVRIEGIEGEWEVISSRLILERY
ncbi:MAG: hypothetical protein ACI8RD_013076 [Bacillariaceae sp.]|jgi:hypothetical protein